MLPLRADLPSRTVPFVTVSLIGLNVIAFTYQMSLRLGAELGTQAAQAFLTEFGAMPCRLSGGCLTAEAFPHPVATIFTSMFLHGGLFHVGANMLYLWIFGGNVEDTLGHGRFLVFYLSSGLAAVLAQTVMNPQSHVPIIGASGAVSGILGAYLLLFPYATVLTLLTVGFYFRFIHVPALVVLGFWIVVQLINAVLTVGASGRGHDGGGVAWFAHVGGFMAGIALLFLLRPRRAARL
jgi:membrane associated rhomboid family serine protease